MMRFTAPVWLLWRLVPYWQHKNLIDWKFLWNQISYSSFRFLLYRFNFQFMATVENSSGGLLVSGNVLYEFSAFESCQTCGFTLRNSTRLSQNLTEDASRIFTWWSYLFISYPCLRMTQIYYAEKWYLKRMLWTKTAEIPEVVVLTKFLSSALQNKLEIFSEKIKNEVNFYTIFYSFIYILTSKSLFTLKATFNHIFPFWIIPKIFSTSIKA